MCRVSLYLKSGAIVKLLLNKQEEDELFAALNESKESPRYAATEIDGTMHLIDWRNVDHMSIRMGDE